MGRRLGFITKVEDPDTISPLEDPSLPIEEKSLWSQVGGIPLAKILRAHYHQRPQVREIDELGMLVLPQREAVVSIGLC